MSSLATFSSPNYFIGQQSDNLDVSFVDTDKYQPRKYQLVHCDDPEMCPKSARRREHCRIAFNATDVLLVKTVGVREITDKTGSKKKFSGNIYLNYLTKCSTLS